MAFALRSLRALRSAAPALSKILVQEAPAVSAVSVRAFTTSMPRMATIDFMASATTVDPLAHKISRKYQCYDEFAKELMTKPLPLGGDEAAVREWVKHYLATLKSTGYDEFSETATETASGLVAGARSEGKAVKNTPPDLDVLTKLWQRNFQSVVDDMNACKEDFKRASSDPAFKDWMDKVDVTDMDIRSEIHASVPKSSRDFSAEAEAFMESRV